MHSYAHHCERDQGASLRRTAAAFGCRAPGPTDLHDWMDSLAQVRGGSTSGLGGW